VFSRLSRRKEVGGKKHMSKVEELKNEIERLPKEEFTELCRK
jgi:hypothetical protein